MKKIILITFLTVLSLPVFSQVKQFNNLEKARIIALQENKNILLVFSGSDWCVPCMRLEKEILSQPEFLAFAAKNLVMVNIDFPLKSKNKKRLSSAQKNYNGKLCEKYNPNGLFPYVVVLNSKGEVKAQTGYKKMSSEAYASHINTLINLK